MDKLYNKDIKERYLNEQYSDNQDSQTTVRYLFQKAELIEDVLQKDLYNFNMLEIGKIIQNANPHSSYVAKSYTRFLSKYISWAIKTGLRDNNIHPLRGTDTSWSTQFVNKSKKIHYSEEEFYEDIVEKLPNAQDQAYISLIFDGILGKESSEIRFLECENVKSISNEITVMEIFDGEFSTRTLKVSDKTMKYLIAAQEQEIYYNYQIETGEFIEKELLPSKYVFKNVKSPRATVELPVSQHVLYSRMSNIKTYLDLEYLTPHSIRQSGMLFMSVEMYIRDKKLGYDQLAEVGERYKFSKLYNNGFSYINTSLMKEFVNSDNIKELYGIDLDITKF